MTEHHRLVAALRDALAELYPDEPSARRVCRDTGLDVRQISFSTHAVNNWTAILDEAEKQTAVSDLVAVARKEYPKYTPLLNAATAYEQALPAAVPSRPLTTPPAPKQSQPTRRLPGWVWVAGGILAVVLVVLGVLNGPWLFGRPTPTSAPLTEGPPAISTSAPPAATSTRVVQATATPTVMPTWQPPNSPIAFDWVEIPAGEFTMGSDPQQDSLAYDYEQPQHTENVDTFWIGRTEVTVAQFAAFVEATGYRTTAEQQGSSYTWTGTGWRYVEGANWRAPRGPGSSVDDKQDHPVTHISWNDAQAFSQWAGVRLPSEAEWEMACRGGEDNRIYPWGNNGPDKSLANFNMDVGDTTAVGSYPAGQSPYGLLDLSGNAWEWTQTKWRSDYSSPADDSAGGDAARVGRGGSFLNNARVVRCAVRYVDGPSSRVGNFGFRVVVSP